ncbi:MAG: M28 family peptidase, partial [Acidobacteriaceae bacterium]
RISIIILITAGLAVAAIFLFGKFNTKALDFDGQRAYEAVKYQVELGPRVTGSQAHEDAVAWIISRLRKKGWETDVQETSLSGIPIQNIVAKRGEGRPWIILASHYDSRLHADLDPVLANRSEAVLGANDGASSVAVLLELGRVLPSRPDKQIWLVFFDAEDNAKIDGYETALGSQYFVSQLTTKPDYVVVLDMVGDKDLNLYMERNSDPQMNEEIWAIAAASGQAQFIPAYKHRMIDDHIPFIEAGIRAIDIIDFDYPFWHTTQDTLDKISAESLQVVGDTILQWLNQPTE